MSHIPEEALHAYLDQGLGRLECVEIESHLAECTWCRTRRDEIAALRDRTTALLTRLAPRRHTPPPFTVIRRRADERLRLRQRRLQRLAWAASVLVALGAGWAGSWYANVPRTERVALTPPRAAGAPAAAPAPAPVASAAPAAGIVVPNAPAAGEPVATAPVPEPVSDAPEQRAPAVAVAQPLRKAVREPAPEQATARVLASRNPPQPVAAEVATVGGIPHDAQLELGGVWRTVSWDGAKQDAVGDAPPRISGLPVMEVQVQGGDTGRRPLMVVAQQLASGEVIRTIEGPVADVSVLLGTKPASVSSESTSAPVPDGPPSPAGFSSAMAVRQGDRMVAVTGSISRDSLRLMMQRLNLMMRR